MASTSLWKSHRFALVLLISIALGSGLGLLLGPRAATLKPLGDVFLNLMFTVVVPLVFFTIASAVANTGGVSRIGRILGVLLGVFVATGVVASVLMIIGVKVFPPGTGVTLPSPEAVTQESQTLSEALVRAFSVPDFADLLSRRNVLPLIVFAILFGLAASRSGEAGKRVARGLDAVAAVLIRLVGLVMLFAPIGLGAYFANLVGVFGPTLLREYGRAMLLYYPLSIAYFFVFFTLYAWLAGGRRGAAAFWSEIPTPAFTALGTQSSVATIPSNLLAAERIGVPRDIREMAIGIGATIHMDGSCLSAVLKIAMLFGLYGRAFEGFDVYAACIGVALLSGMVMAGIPGGGFLGELMIVTLYGFPPETAFPVLAVLGTLVDPPATMVNATGDNVCSMMIARVIEGRGWRERGEADPAVMP